MIMLAFFYFQCLNIKKQMKTMNSGSSSTGKWLKSTLTKHQTKKF